MEGCLSGKITLGVAECAEGDGVCENEGSGRLEKINAEKSLGYNCEISGSISPIS
jgi:hypothetical protein